LLINSILLVEDSDEDLEVFCHIMQQLSYVYPIYRCCNGDDALDFLFQTGNDSNPDLAPRPALILLDLNLPGTDGREVIEIVKQDENLQLIPLVVFTTSSNPKDLDFCYQKGVNSYLVKSMGIEALSKAIANICNYWIEINIDYSQNKN
jgi:CheY-like chemotaxis protein